MVVAASVSYAERKNRNLERLILDLLSRRRSGATICPSDVARLHDGEDWRGLMEAVRTAAWRLEAEGQVVILKGGKRIGRGAARGPIRIGLFPPTTQADR